MSGDQEEPDGLYVPDGTEAVWDAGVAWIEDPNKPVQVYLLEDEMLMYFGDPKSPEWEELLRYQRQTMLDRVREILRKARHR